MRIDLLSVVALLAAGIAANAGTDGAMMQAAVVVRARIRIQEVPRPAPAPGQVLVRLRCAGVNPADWKLAMGRPDAPPGSPGDAAMPAASSIPGFDGSGVIAALGAGVTGHRVGDAVIVWSADRGTYAQYVAVSASTIAPKPKRLSFAEAAGLAHAGLAAWNMLIDVAGLQAGQTVLVLGGAGGVGSAAVQIARLQGAHVIATASARNVAYLKSLGADRVIDYTAQHFEDQLRGVDVAVDTVDLDNAERALAVVKRGGFLVSVGTLPAAAQCAAHGVTCSNRTWSGTPLANVLQRLSAWADQGRFKVNVDRTFALADVMGAWQYSQAGHTRGKAVIDISP